MCSSARAGAKAVSDRVDVFGCAGVLSGRGWWLWAGLLFIMGRRYAEPLGSDHPADEKRKWLAVLGAGGVCG